MQLLQALAATRAPSYTERMISTESAAGPPLAAESPVNYDSAAVVELTIDEADYRIDAGKQGTALSISNRPTGTWQWRFVCEARWDGSSLRSRALERPLLQRLSRAFAEAVANME